jgi:TonB family protein
VPRLPLIAEEPKYLASLSGTGGRVELRVLVDEAGQVTEVAGMSGDRALVDAAKKAVRGWKYSSPEKQGVKVKVWLIIPVQFVLPSR